MTRTARSLLLLALLLSATAVRADWLDDYEAGMKAAEQQKWDVVVQKMSSAIAAKPKEGRERPYGNVFVEYHPFYYRGIAYYELGQYQRSIDDLERATGTGRVKLQSAEGVITRAQARLAQAQPVIQPPSQPPTQTAQPAQPSPVVAQADTLLEQARQRAATLIAQAEQGRSDAQRQSTATLAPDAYVKATQTLADARTRMAGARSTADWRRVADLADQAKNQFAAAIAQAQAQIARQQAAPVRAADAVLADARARVRRALDDYFEGRFSDAALQFERLAENDLRTNPLIWVFLGAAQYSAYYVDGEKSGDLRKKAEASFRQARRLRKMRDLPSDYFSPRVRRFYAAIK